jgi:Tol biopolymer transport system component
MRSSGIPVSSSIFGIIAVAVLVGCGDDNPTKAPPGSTWETPGTPEAATSFPSNSPNVSPDGALLAMELGSGGIATMPLAGGALDTLSTSFVSGPDWSPDGSKIVVDGGGGLGIIDVSTKAATPLGTGDVDGDPAWSPDGSKIAARTTMGGDGIGITTYPGAAWSILPCVDQNGATCDGEGPTWAPDGSAIAFEDGVEILAVPSAGGTATVVAEGVGDVTRPSWSPSGQWIAFEAESVGTGPLPQTYDHIWIADSRGMQHGLHQITFGPSYDRQPSWSSDSRTIYFTSDRGGSIAIWKVAIQP